MAASAGRYGVNIGMGAASGAGMGTAIFPGVGTAIGGVLGGLAGGLQTLLTSSDEAKQKKKALDEYEKQRAQQLQAYKQQQLEASQADWDRRWASMTGIDKSPAYAGLSYKPYDPHKVEADFNLRSPDESQRLGENFDAQIPQPNYGALAQSLGSLGSTVGTLSRQSDAADKLGLAQINATKNPWQADAGTTDPGLEQLLEQARQAAWNRTGGW